MTLTMSHVEQHTLTETLPMPYKHFCLSCSKTFASVSALRSHSIARGHIANPFFCEACELSFLSMMALESHMSSSRHAEDYIGDANPYSIGGDQPCCEGCRRRFTDMVAMNRHLFASPKHNWCFECSRDFSSGAALLQHQNSLAHSGRDFKCPFCPGMFKSPSGIAMHIESGCNDITRHQVTAAVHAMNIPNISVKRITVPSCPPTLQTFIATEASFNGSAYECYLCNTLFRTLLGLNGHLNSPAHDDDEFRCPRCKTQFKLISGFIQHLESRCCGLGRTLDLVGDSTIIPSSKVLEAPKLGRTVDQVGDLAIVPSAKVLKAPKPIPSWYERAAGYVALGALMYYGSGFFAT